MPTLRFAAARRRTDGAGGFFLTSIEEKIAELDHHHAGGATIGMTVVQPEEGHPLNLARPAGRREGGGIQLTLPMVRYDLAELRAGVRRGSPARASRAPVGRAWSSVIYAFGDLTARSQREDRELHKRMSSNRRTSVSKIESCLAARMRPPQRKGPALPPALSI